MKLRLKINKCLYLKDKYDENILMKIMKITTIMWFLKKQLKYDISTSIKHNRILLFSIFYLTKNIYSWIKKMKSWNYR